MSVKNIIDVVQTLPKSFNQIIWFPDDNCGYFPVRDEDAFIRDVYCDSYFDKFHRYESTDLGINITKFRCSFVMSHYVGPVVDIGVGSGHFIKKYRQLSGSNSLGYDIALRPKQLLINDNLYYDPYAGQKPDAITCWDSLEHIKKCWVLISRASKYFFLTVPLVKNAESCLYSKHYKPLEHYWYFTFAGVLSFFESLGFELIGHAFDEANMGREDVCSFAFKR